MKVIKETLYLKDLGREATLYVGLPNHYDEELDESYPVLYMHDGQNLFFEEDAAYGKTWRVQHAFEQNPALPSCLVVGLSCAHGFDRLTEYGPFVFDYDGFKTPHPVGGGGDRYLNTLIDVVMPLIESRYRVKKGPLYTAIMGSSMGGVISVYAGLKYPHVFGRIASLSGAFYVSLKACLEAFEEGDFSALETFYMDTGDQEVGGGQVHHYLESNDAVYQVLDQKLKTAKKRYVIVPGGKHHEDDWAHRFAEVLAFIWS